MDQGHVFQGFKKLSFVTGLVLDHCSRDHTVLIFLQGLLQALFFQGNRDS